jgi:tetratricopeptide (TPR) repeat protein
MKIPRLADSFVVFAIISLSGLSLAQQPGPEVPKPGPSVEKNPAIDVASLLAKARDLGAVKDWKALRGIGREIVAAEPDNLEGNAWLGIASANAGFCKEGIVPLTKAFNAHAAVAGVPKALGRCLGTRPANRILAGRAWLAAARDDKDGDEALKAAKLLAGNPKAAPQLFDAYAYADERGKLPDGALPDFASAAEAARKTSDAKSIYERAIKNAPEDRTLLLALARLDLKLKDATGAQQIADRLLATNPSDQDAVIVRADAAAMLADPVSEEKVLREALIKQSQNPALKKRLAIALGHQARARIDAQEPKSARGLAEEALKLDAENVPAKESLARVLWGDGNRAKAAQVLGKIADSPDSEISGEGLRIAAEVAMDTRDLKRAKTLLDRAGRLGSEHLATSQARLTYLKGDFSAAEKRIAAYLALSPDDGEALRLGGDIAYDSGRIRTARDRYERADTTGSLPLAGQGRLCEIRARDNDYEGARRACEKALRGGQDDAAVHANLGLALARLRDRDGARKEIEIAILKGASDKSTQLVRGLIAESDGRDGDALEFYDKVLAVDSGNVEANTQSGKLLLKRAKYHEAAIRLGKAFRANPRSYDLAVALAKAQFGTGALGDAQKTIRGIPEGAIDDATRLGLDGQVQHALGNYKKANELFARALQKSPNNAELLALQGENYLNLPHYEKAIQLLEAAQKEDPSRLDVSERLARLYAETGDADKAAKQLARIDSSENATTPPQRRSSDSRDLRRVAVSKDFEAIGSIDDPMLAGLGRVLKDAVAADISLSPYIEVIDHTDENQDLVRDARDNMRAKGVAGTSKAPERYARYALSGSYQMVGDSMQLSCAITDINTRQSYRGSAAGSKDRWTEIEKRAVLEMLATFVPLSPEERASLERAALKRAQRGNLESVVLMKDADDAKHRGDYRAALQYLEEAHAADLGNARAFAELVRVRKEVTRLNRVAVLATQKIGDVDDAFVLGLRYTLSSKLSGVHGIQVIDNNLVDSVLRAERDYLIENRENIDPQTLPQAAATQIAANVIMQPFIQGHGDGITVGATLIQMSDGRILLGDQVTGTRANLLDIQNELALDIVRKLYGEPTEQEMAILLKKQSMEEYQQDMAELARLRAERRIGFQSPQLALDEEPHVNTKPRATKGHLTTPKTPSSTLIRPPAPHRPVNGSRGGWTVAGLVTAGVGLVGIGAGVYYGQRARSIADELTSSQYFNSQRDNERKTAITLQYVGYTVGGVAVASGLVMYLLGTRSSNIALVPQAASGYAGISIQGYLQ